MRLLFILIFALLEVDSKNFLCPKRESININAFLEQYKVFHKNLEKNLSNLKEGEEGPIVIPVYNLKNNDRIIIYYNQKYEIRDILDKKFYIYHNYSKPNKEQIVKFYETFVYNENGKLITYKRYVDNNLYVCYYNKQITKIHYKMKNLFIENEKDKYKRLLNKLYKINKNNIGAIYKFTDLNKNWLVINVECFEFIFNIKNKKLLDITFNNSYHRLRSSYFKKILDNDVISNEINYDYIREYKPNLLSKLRKCLINYLNKGESFAKTKKICKVGCYY